MGTRFLSGSGLPKLKVTPDRNLAARYAGASGDFNPIHIDAEFAQSVGWPDAILHGLWTMAQVARMHTEAAGGPAHLKSLYVQFRGMALPEREIVVSSTVQERRGDRAILATQATQGGKRVVRNGRAELEL
jgi:acyl dehydratase